MPAIPHGIDALLFDMDGVLTDTARLHAAAWKQTFDEFLSGSRPEHRPGDGPDPHRPFALPEDYHRYVDGRPRYDGVRTFLASRGITLEEPDVVALGDRKNELLQARLAGDGVELYPDAGAFLRAARDAGYRTALVSSSKNARAIVSAAGVLDLFDAVVDGTSLEPRGLRGKPAPDSFVAAAGDVGSEVARAAVLEDAVAGVAAGREGGFGLVVGVDRHDDPQPLLDGGADVVVSALTDLTLAGGPADA
jgi:beta-phosphoglucomutase family hydrolase